MKRLISLLFCMIPFAARSATLPDNCVVGEDGNITCTGAVDVLSSSDAVVGGTDVPPGNMTVNDGGLTAAGDLVIGQDYTNGDQTGSIWVESVAESGFTMDVADGDVTISGETVIGGTSASDAVDVTITAQNATFTGGVNVNDASSLNVTANGDSSAGGSITAGDVTLGARSAMTMTAGNGITTADVSVGANSTLTIDASTTGDVTMGNLEIADGTTARITGDEITIGEESAPATPATVTVGSSNSSAKTNLNITAGTSLTVNGAMVLYNQSNVAVNAPSATITGALSLTAGTGGFTMTKGGNLSVGGIASNGDLTISGADVLTSTNAINVASGASLTLSAGTINANDMIMQNGAETTITANTVDMSTGTLQMFGGTLNLASATSGQNMTMTVGALDFNGANTVAGTETVLNAAYLNNVNGLLKMNLAGLNLTGAAESGGASLVTAGNVNITVGGNTFLRNGFDISNMGSDGEFSLTTDTLSFGVTQDVINDIASLNINVTQGALDLGRVENVRGNMSLAGNNITVGSITTTAGTVRIGTNAESGNITVGNSIVNNGATTNIVANGTLTVSAGQVSNTNGTMTINGLTESIINGSVSNSGGTLNLFAGDALETGNNTDQVFSGAMTINGTVGNTGSGNMYIHAGTVSIGGMLNQSSTGAAYVQGSTSVALSGATVSNGTLYVDTNGSDNNRKITSSGAVSVTGGQMVIGNGATAFNVNNASATFAGDVLFADDTPGSGNGDLVILADNESRSPFTFGAQRISIGGNIDMAQNQNVHTLVLNATNNLYVGCTTPGGCPNYSLNSESGNVTVGADGALTLSAGGSVNVYGDALVKGGALAFGTNIINVGSLTQQSGLVAVNGTDIALTATNDTGVYIANAINFGNTASSGMNITGDSMTITTDAGDITVGGGITLASGKELSLKSAADVSVSGNVSNTGGTLTVVADDDVVGAANINNYGDVTIAATNGDVTLGGITGYNGSTMTVDGGTIKAAQVTMTGGALTMTSADEDITVAGINISGNNNARVILNSDSVTVQNNGSVVISNGGIVQDSDPDGSDETGNALFLTSENVGFKAGSLNIATLTANENSGTYTIANGAHISQQLSVADGASVSMTAQSVSGNGQTNASVNVAAGGSLDITTSNGSIVFSDITNSGNLALTATNGGMSFGQIENNNDGITDLTLASANQTINATSLDVTWGGVILNGENGTLNLTAVADAFSTVGALTQNSAANPSAGGVNIVADKYTISAANMNVGNGINQTSGALELITNDLEVLAGGINATDLTIKSAGDYMNIGITGNVSGGVKFNGLEHMLIKGNYMFDDTSAWNNIAILPYATGNVADSTTYNYWSSVSLADDGTLGRITNAADGQALIQINGKMTTDLNPASNTLPFETGQVSLNIFDVVDQGTAIWLVHANKGIEDLHTKMRNLEVLFCNADASLCIDYLAAMEKYNDDGLGAYLTERDSNGDGVVDDIYVVFDPRFGGPAEVFKIQPVVGATSSHTHGEWESAGALDELLASKLRDAKFYNRTILELIPPVFAGSNLETMANELYKRMEQYVLTGSNNGEIFNGFSRLFQPREMEQIAGSIVLNEHTNARDFEDHMFDEFIWNRNRRLRKAWLDVSYGMYSQDVRDDKTVDGNRFSIVGGYDWQASNTLILGLAGRVSHMSGDNRDSMNLAYLTTEPYIAGNVSLSVADTDIGIGGYMLQTLGTKARLYGNLFLDAHLLDVSRDQNYVDHIDGSGTAISLVSEWGLLHDWLNQYIVGNLYARIGYNFGFAITERAGGADYMNMESDGYLMLTPGYSLIAQKRIYPTVWFQVRPYASIGIEYDLLGAPNHTLYKFAPSHKFTEYSVDIDPLWANGGVGVEFLSATGLQIGVDYRYQYNADIQLHNIRVSGSYRF